MGGEGSGNFGHEGRPGLVGGSGEGGPGVGAAGAKFDRASYEKMSMGDRRASWDKLSVADRDKLADARYSVDSRVKGLVSTMGAWQNTGDLEKDVQARVDSAKEEMSQSSNNLVSYTATIYDDSLKAAGVDDESRGKLVCLATDYLIAQEMETQNRQLGDHGVHHIAGDIDRAFQIASVLPEGLSSQQKCEIITASVFHDAGYLTDPSRIFLDEGHPRWSAQNYDQNIAPVISAAFGKDVADNVGYYIRTHDSTDINWKEDPVGSSVRVSDNTALFEVDKLPGVFRDVKGTYQTLSDFNAGKINLEDAKSNMMTDIHNSALSDSLKSRYMNAVTEMTDYTPKSTLGMKGGDIYDITWAGDHVAITLKYNEQKTQDQKLLDLGQAQFAKFAKAYGSDPYSFKTTLGFTFDKNGQVLLEGRIYDPDKPLTAVYSEPIDNRQVK
jgi:hypothetical protein